jgi:uncharacterized protein (DUF2141 family)
MARKKLNMMQKLFKKFRSQHAATWFTLILFFLIFAGFEAFISSCASRSNPSGGDKDTLAPQLDTSFPANQSIYFKSTTISLKFEEYITLKSPQQQIRISPLLPEDLEIVSKGKEILIKALDSLKENTTYIISFGTSITDLTEGNVNKEFKYVFSTGSYIDSLSLQGRLKDAYTGEAESDMLVLLYSTGRKSSRDSLLYKVRPDYYAFSNDEGNFSMTNMRSGTYLLAAFTDKDGDFKLNSGKEKMAFWTDTIDLQPDSLYAYQLNTFDPKPKFRYINARHGALGEISFNFSSAADSFKIEAIDVPEDSAYFKYNVERDTLYYRFQFQRDSILFMFNYDTLFVDSVVSVRLREYDEPKLKITSSANQFRKVDTVFIYSNVAINQWFEDSTAFYTPKDTIKKLPLRDSARAKRWFYPPPHSSDFSVMFNKGAAEHSGDNRLKDSTVFNFQMMRGEDLGTLVFNVSADSGQAYLLQILKEDDAPCRFLPFKDSIRVVFKNELPQKYKVFLIRDFDEDGEWTTGDFILGHQPELRIPYAEGLEIRANWELDLEWQYHSDAINNK